MEIIYIRIQYIFLKIRLAFLLEKQKTNTKKKPQTQTLQPPLPQSKRLIINDKL